MANTPVLPVPEPEALPFFEAAARGELQVQRCVDTGRLIFPPRPMSPWGQRQEPEWVAVSGRGTIWSFVVPHPPVLPQFADLAPYNVIVVALEEDPTIRLVGNLVAAPDAGIDSVDPATLEIGAPVRAVFQALDGEFTLPRWVLA